DNQLDDAYRRKELTTLLSFGHCKLAEEVFVNLAKGVSLNRHRDRRKVLQQRDQQVLLETVVCLGENVLQVFIVSFNRLHRLVDRLADVRALGKIEQVAEPGLLGQIENPL